VARLDLGRRRADALGVEALELWIDRLILGCHDVPAAKAVPVAARNFLAKNRCSVSCASAAAACTETAARIPKQRLPEPVLTPACWPSAVAEQVADSELSLVAKERWRQLRSAGSAAMA
jgi:hypothetical protein